jgi:translation initiation factor 4G
MQQKLRQKNPSGGCSEKTRTIRSILNKITVDNFESMYRNLLSSGMFQVEVGEVLAQEIFAKATVQHHFVKTYAKLSFWIHKSFVAGQKSKENGLIFQTSLLHICELGLSTALQPMENLEGMDPEERDEAELKHKEQVLGTFKFIAALLEESVLPGEQLLVTVCETLLKEGTPWSLECLSAFLTVAGPAFDRKESKHQDPLKVVFRQVCSLRSSNTLPARTRFLLQDLLDLRKASWKKTA